MDITTIVFWEEAAMTIATCIMFWIPRDIQDLPGYTTNIEFGEFMSSGKVVLGAPQNAPKMSYLWEKALRWGIPTAYTLEETIHLALQMIEQKSRTF